MEVRVVLHIGPMKTGTEALTARFVGAPDTEGIIIPSGAAWPQSRDDVIKHPEIELLGTRRGAEWERRLADIVADARSRSGKRMTILLVSEATNTAKQPAIIAERILAHADRLDVVFFARRQEAAVPSWLSQRVQSWTQTEYTALDLDAVLLPARRYFRYDRIMDRWTIPGVTLIPVPFFEKDRKSDALFTRFADATGIAVPKAHGDRAVNESLGEAALGVLGAFKQRWAWTRGIPVASDIARFCFNRLRRRLQRSEPTARWTLTKAETARITEHYRESNAAFKKALGAKARRPEWKTWFAA